jgi:uncharacterized protein YndB with AHSA1/START domain
MSIEFDLRQHVAAPPERVWRALTELDRAGEWMPGFVRAERLTGDGFGVGTRWRETRKVFGKEATEEFEVTEFEPPSSLGLFVDGRKGAMKQGEFRFRYRLEPAGGGTDVHLHSRVGGFGPIAGFFARLFSGYFRKACEKDLKALADYAPRAGGPAGAA